MATTQQHVLDNFRHAAASWFLLAFVSVASSQETASFTILPGYQALGIPVAARALDVSADGSLVVGNTSTNIAGYIYNVDSRELDYLGSYPDGSFRNVGLAISGDGSKVIGRGLNDGNREAFFYNTLTKNVTYAGSLPNAQGFEVAWSISNDGKYVAGQRDLGRGRTPFAYDLSTSTAIPVRVGGLGPAAGISDDGTRIVGHHTTNGGIRGFFYDTLTGRTVNLEDLPGGRDYSVATAISADGSTVIGASDTAAGLEPIIYDVPTGTTTRLGELLSSETSVSYNIVATRDGAAIIGFSSSHLFVHEYVAGQNSLEDTLVQSIELGFVIRDFNIGGVTSISDDGLTIVGWGTIANAESRAWVVVIPEPVSAFTATLLLGNLVSRRRVVLP